MTDRLMALFAYLMLAGFLAILLVFVPRLDLGAVVAVTLLMVAWDFFWPRPPANRR
jgi:hypothetical protein